MLPYIFFSIFSAFYTLLSYSFTSRNLVLSSNQYYLAFQNYMWSFSVEYRELLAPAFAVVLVVLFISYASIVINLKNKAYQGRKPWFVWHYVFIVGIFCLSYNAFSLDVFNYLFNGRMVIVYGANPHIQTALDFPQDLWTRFMHNTHTPAPYGYGWTALSLVPVFLGMGKFLPTLMLMRGLILVSLILLYFALNHLSQTLNNRKLRDWEVALFFYNPFVLLEVVSNYHNDLWMMAPAVLATSLFLRGMSTNAITVRSLALAWVLLLFSISIKLVTIVLIPLALFTTILYILQKNKILIVYVRPLLSRYLEQVQSGAILFSMALLFLPLITVRSQQFLSWYLLWPFVFIPVVRHSVVKNTLLLFSMTAVLRYLPLIGAGFEYSGQINMQQKIILWMIPVLYCLSSILRKKKHAVFQKA